jgi:hypothetical protein
VTGLGRSAARAAGASAAACGAGAAMTVAARRVGAAAVSAAARGAGAAMTVAARRVGAAAAVVVVVVSVVGAGCWASGVGSGGGAVRCSRYRSAASLSWLVGSPRRETVVAVGAVGEQGLLLRLRDGSTSGPSFVALGESARASVVGVWQIS